MKNSRHKKIIEIIKDEAVETQEELAELLNREGFQVTQATVSRDIKQLKLVKISTDGGGQRYALHREGRQELNEKFVRVLRDGFISMDMAQNILVIKTVSGMAMAVAAALDALHFPQMVGCIAGDDTVMCAIRSVEDTYTMMDHLRAMLG
ncbi:MAG: arginine repressor [Lachnospiraceae bacterium]